MSDPHPAFARELADVLQREGVFYPASTAEHIAGWLKDNDTFVLKYRARPIERGLSGTHYQILGALYGHAGRLDSEIARRFNLQRVRRSHKALNVSVRTIASRRNELVRMGHVEEGSRVSGSRSKTWKLTDSGKQLYAQEIGTRQ